MYDFGNNQNDGYTPRVYKPDPTDGVVVDYNPDHQPSSSGCFIEDRGEDIIAVFPVRHLGVVVLRVAFDDVTGKRIFKGMSIFTDQEIGFHK